MEKVSWNQCPVDMEEQLYFVMLHVLQNVSNAGCPLSDLFWLAWFVPNGAATAFISSPFLPHCEIILPPNMALLMLYFHPPGHIVISESHKSAKNVAFKTTLNGTRAYWSETIL